MSLAPQTSEKKLGFWSVTSLVAGSQIGSSIFLLPASLAGFGALGLTSWFITGGGALLLALVFAGLCACYPKTGGPHAYIEAAFGKKVAFFAAWTYWMISWMSSPVVVIAVIAYLSPVLGSNGAASNLFLELMVLAIVMALNLRSVHSVGRVEFIFTLLKLLPLLIVPVVGLFFIQWEHFSPFNPTGESPLTVINSAALLTLWGFIGVESATTPAESVQNARKVIPRAIVIGTAIVAFVYILGTFSIMAVVPPALLASSKAPFAEASAILFGGNWYKVISVMAAIVCFGTLNAWVLTSGQIALGAANDGHFPEIFKKKNARGAPIWSLLISVIGMIPILILTKNENLVAQINTIIDISVTAFLFVYVFSVFSYLKLFWKNSETQGMSFKSILIGLAALLFCCWAFWSSGLKMISLASIIVFSGLPVYWLKNKIPAWKLKSEY